MSREELYEVNEEMLQRIEKTAATSDWKAIDVLIKKATALQVQEIERTRERTEHCRILDAFSTIEWLVRQRTGDARQPWVCDLEKYLTILHGLYMLEQEP
jgi:hypothetical protein